MSIIRREELSEKNRDRYFEKVLFSVKEKAEKERIVFASWMNLI